MEKIKAFTNEVIQKVADDNSYTIGADQTIYGTCPKCEKEKLLKRQKRSVAVNGNQINVRLQFGKKWHIKK